MRLKAEATWSLPECLSTGTVRGPDHAWPMKGDHTMSLDQDTAWMLGVGYIRLSPLLSKQVCCLPFTWLPVSVPLTPHQLNPSPGAIRTQKQTMTWQLRIYFLIQLDGLFSGISWHSYKYAVLSKVGGRNRDTWINSMYSREPFCLETITQKSYLLKAWRYRWFLRNKHNAYLVLFLKHKGF